MIRFEKVSFEQFQNSLADSEELSRYVPQAEEIYQKITIPERATKGSAGYDFVTPVNIVLSPGQSIKIPTGIRILLDCDKVLMLFPRSGLGTKFRMQLDNTVGVVDSDYSDSANEGHIFIKITNDSKQAKLMKIEAFQKFAQGVILQYFVTDNDNADKDRNGGFGSTDEKIS